MSVLSLRGKKVVKQKKENHIVRGFYPIKPSFEMAMYIEEVRDDFWKKRHPKREIQEKKSWSKSFGGNALELKILCLFWGGGGGGWSPSLKTRGPKRGIRCILYK